MQFFKKVLKFFSTLWHAISWGKHDKKTRDASGSDKEDGQLGEDTSTTSVQFVAETDKLFFDVPLESSETNVLEPGLVVHSKPATPSSPIASYVKCGVQVEFGADDEDLTKRFLLGEQEVSRSLSFFSEPIRDPETIFDTPTTEHVHGLGGNDSIINGETVLGSADDPELATTDDGYDDLPTPPNAPISNDSLLEQHALGESQLVNIPAKSPNAVTQLTASRYLDEKTEEPQSFTSFPNHLCVVPTSMINPDLIHLAVGDQIHLFDHNGIPDILPVEGSFKAEQTGLQLEESEDHPTDQPMNPDMLKEPKELEAVSSLRNTISKVYGNDGFGPISDQESRGIENGPRFVAYDDEKSVGGLMENSQSCSLQKAKCDEEILNDDTAKPPSTSCSDVGLEFSVKPTQTISDVIDESSVYYTNYTVKSDSLVNLFPGDDFPNDNEIVNTNALLDAKQSMPKDAVFPEQDCLEEIMCTPTGILNLSGANRVDEDWVKSGPYDLKQVSSPDELEGCFPPKLEVANQSTGSIQNGSDLSATISMENNNHQGLIGTSEKIGGFPLIPEECNSLLQTLTDNVEELRNSGVPETVACFPVVDDHEDPVIQAVHSQLFSQNRSLEAAPVDISFQPHLAHVEEPLLHFSSDVTTIIPRDSAKNLLSLDTRQCLPAENSCEISQQYHSIVGDDIERFCPYVDCSSFLARIPEEIRKEPTFNPCVGARTRFGPEDECEMRYPNTCPLASEFLIGVPMMDSNINEDYVDPDFSMANLDYDENPVPHDIEAFWESQQAIGHPGYQQSAVVGYPEACSEDFNYENNGKVMSLAKHENDLSTSYTDCASSVNPTINFPFGLPPPPFAYGGPMPPLIFPVSPQTYMLPSANQEVASENEEYPHIGRVWRASNNIRHDDRTYGKDVAQVVGTGSTLQENVSMRTYEAPYFQVKDNLNLKTSLKKADSLSSSLLCESLRSIISQNTESENMLSLSCSSVQECPSVLTDSCNITLSNDSLSPMILANRRIKVTDEDYLATEKFMNDVNTALSQSVIDETQHQFEMHLLGQGDGFTENEEADLSGNDDTQRNSLGENISINNSKLTLLDGVLRTGSGETLSAQNQTPGYLETERNESIPSSANNVRIQDQGESSNAADAYCQQVVHLLLESIFARQEDDNAVGLQSEVSPEIDEECVELQSPKKQLGDLIVQSMMVIEGLNHGLWKMRDGTLAHAELEMKSGNTSLEMSDSVGEKLDVSFKVSEDETGSLGDAALDKLIVSIAGSNSSITKHHNRRELDGQSEGDEEQEKDNMEGLKAHVIDQSQPNGHSDIDHCTDNSMGECSGAQGEVLDAYRNQVNGCQGSSESKDTQIDNDPSKDGSGELASSDGKDSAICKENVGQGSDGNVEDEEEAPDEIIKNANRRRRNRRRKRRN